MNKQFKRGFTFVELVVVIGIIAMLSSFITLNFFKTQNTVSLETTVSLFISDLKAQQLNMMSGNTNGQAANIPFGIHFDQNRYVLYHSSAYSSNDSGNFVVNLNNGVTFSQINLPNSALVFASGSGEIQGYNQSQNTITLQNGNSGDQKTITVNRYGVITSVN